MNFFDFHLNKRQFLCQVSGSYIRKRSENKTVGQEMKNTLVAFILALCIVGSAIFLMKKALTPRNLAAEDPRKVFEQFVCSPVPEGVSDFHSSGVVAFAGGEARIDFRFDAESIDRILELGGFRPYKSGDPGWISDFEPPSFSGSLLRYVRPDLETSHDALFLSVDTGRAWYREAKF